MIYDTFWRQLKQHKSTLKNAVEQAECLFVALGAVAHNCEENGW